MAAKKRTPARPPSRRGGRDYAAEYAYRVRGTAKGSRERTAARGHRGQLAAFKRFIREGDRILCDISAPTLETRTRRVTDRRTKKGFRVVKELVYDLIEKQVITFERAGTKRPPASRLFKLPGLTRRELIALIDYEQSKGVTFSPQPSLDQRRLVTADEAEGGY